MRCAIKESLCRLNRSASRLAEAKGHKPPVPFGAGGRVKVAIFVLGLVLLFVGLLGAACGWLAASSRETAQAFTCSPSGTPEPYPGSFVVVLSSWSSDR